jgi:hypothetical protein
MRRWVVAALVAALRASGLAAGADVPDVDGRPPRFEDIAKKSGAAVRHHPPIFDSRLGHIMEMLAAGAAGAGIGDYNNDGWLDVFVNDAREGTESKLLRNNGDGTFTDVAGEAGLGGLNRDGQVASTGLFFDYNGDGWQDLLVLRLGVPQLFVNRRNGRFANVSAQAGFTRATNALSAAVLDFDRDGDLDVYLGAYFVDTNMFALDRTHVLHDSWETSRNGGRNLFYRNDGGRFVEVTSAVGLEDTGWTMALGVSDYDRDGWPDIYVANDYGPDKLFRNTGKGRFDDVSTKAIGVDTKKGMNADFGDYDNDGDMDVYVTNVTEAFLHECNMLWQNNGAGGFTDVSVETSTCDTGWGWGGKFFDYDNDGDLDLYVANGFFAGNGDYLDILLPALWDEGEDPSDEKAWPPLAGRGIAGLERNVLFTNIGGRTFRAAKENGADVPSDSRAILTADFDHDGRVDLFVTNQNADSMLLANRTETDHHWVAFHLRGRAPNTDAVGAHLTIESAGRRQVREVQVGNGFGGGSSLVQHVGLAGAARVDRVLVEWPNGEKQEWRDLAADASYRLRQGDSRSERAPAGAPLAWSDLETLAGTIRKGARSLGPDLDSSIGKTLAVDLVSADVEPPAPVAEGPREARTEKSSPSLPAGDGAKAFEDVTRRAGVGHRHHGPSVDIRLRNMGPWFTALGAGGAVGDYNNDGLEDIYVTDSLRGTRNKLYRNDGDMRFTDVAPSLGLSDLNDDNNFSSGALFLDCDNDGWKDLFVVRFGRSRLFRNRGDGTFEDVSGKLHLPTARNPVAAVAFDYDRDSDLDIYLGSYFPDVDLTAVTTTKLLHDSWETARNGGTNVLLASDGQCGFTDVTRTAGLGDTGWTLALGTGDLDRDGWSDLYVANDFGPDKVYRNRGDGTFADVTASAIGIDTKKGMNAEFGDYDNDGWLDIYVTNITEPFLLECNMLWRNNGDFTFTDVSEASGTCDTDWGWGGKFIDYDNDGWLDLYVANGFISGGEKDYIDILMPTILDSEADLTDTLNWPPIGDMSFSGYEKKRFFRNTGRHAFIEVAAELGVDNDRDGRGVLIADFDNDGAQDMYLLASNQEAILYRNRNLEKNAWIELRLKGTKSNRDAIGARVTFYTSKGMQYRETSAGNGFEGQSTSAVHAGFGAADSVERVVVEWPSGARQEFRGVRTRTRYELQEGGQLSPLPSGAPAKSAPGPRRKAGA